MHCSVLLLSFLCASIKPCWLVPGKSVRFEAAEAAEAGLAEAAEAGLAEAAEAGPAEAALGLVKVSLDVSAEDLSDVIECYRATCVHMRSPFPGSC